MHQPLGPQILCSQFRKFRKSDLFSTQRKFPFLTSNHLFLNAYTIN